ncbi:MAG TPA: selenocysteine-specific translation elongation factor [Candidatus Limnocylindrales bacterium]
MTVVIGTAGHIDHGKTTVLRALTGIDADRLPEERARGMTIDVGYAHLALDDGTELDFVDVPGHDRFVGNMLVGAAEIDAAILVIAADDGPRAQTIEHLELLDALEISDGVVVVTKADVVTPERLTEVKAAAAELVAPTTLRGAPVVAVSATIGQGIAELRTALLDLRDRSLARPPRIRAGGSRLAIDRVFSVRGRGTVVTGSLRGGPIAHGAVLRVVPAGVAREIRVREVQVHNRTVDAAAAGRVALNVAGDGVAGLERGVVLTDDPSIVASDRILVALRPLAVSFGPTRPGRAGQLPADRAKITLHLGTARVTGTLGRVGRDAVELDDGGGTAIVRLDRPIAVAAGDRFVLRRPSPAETLVGGWVLDPEPARGVARRRAPPQRVRALAAGPAGSDAWHAAILELHGAGTGTAVGLAPDVADGLDRALQDTVAARPGIPIAELSRIGAADLRRRIGPLSGGDTIVTERIRGLVAAGVLARDGDRVRPPGDVAAGPSPELAKAMDRLVASLSVPSPPSLAEVARATRCPPEGIRLLEQANRIVRLDDDLAWAFPVWRDLATRAVELAATAPLTPAAYRDATGTSRKYVLAILEDLDRRAILRRTPAGHVPGPRAATLSQDDEPTRAAEPVS